MKTYAITLTTEEEAQDPLAAARELATGYVLEELSYEVTDLATGETFIVDLGAESVTRRVPRAQRATDAPRVVCLCGSTRFWRQFQESSLAETLEGRVVLSIGAATATDEEHFGHLSSAERDALKERLDALHLCKIDMADEVLILNVGGYIGPSTARELAYARAQGKSVRFLEPVT